MNGVVARGKCATTPPPRGKGIFLNLGLPLKCLIHNKEQDKKVASLTNLKDCIGKFCPLRDKSPTARLVLFRKMCVYM